MIIFMILFFIVKKLVFYKLLSGSILLYGIYVVVFTLLTLLPLFSDYWYIIIMGILVGVFECIVGKKMLYRKKCYID